MRTLIKAFATPSFKINLICLIVIIGTFYIYSGALTGPFIWDDEHFVLRNPSITSITKVPAFFTSKETFSMNGDVAIYRPLRNISYLIDYVLFGLNPFAFHVSNLILHVQNIILLTYLVRLMTGNNFIAMVSATLFAFHPVQTEAVSWIKGRDDLICTFFYLASFALYLKGREKKGYLYWGSIISFAFALFSKEMALTLPLIIFLYNLHFKSNTKTSYHPYLYLSLSYLLLRTIVVGRVGQTTYWGGSFLTAFYTNLTGLVYYLKLLFFPVNLCADYLTFPVRTNYFDPYVAGALLIILSLSGIAFLSFRKGWYLLSFSISWFFITLLPVSNIVPIEMIIAERFLYLPSIGIILCAAVTLNNLSEGLRVRGLVSNKVFISLVSLIPVFLASMTVDRNHVWAGQHAFWTDIAAKGPGNARAWHNLAVVHHRSGHIAEAVLLYQKAVKIEYHSPETHYQLGVLFKETGEADNALEHFSQALKDGLENADVHYEIANLMLIKEQISDAIYQYKKALENEPEHVDALYDLGKLYIRQKDYNLAAAQFNKLLDIVPGNKMAAGFLAYCERMKIQKE